MSFETIKNGFITFLNGKLLQEELSGKEVEYINYGDDSSIFMHANEFKDYVSDNLDTGAIHIENKSVGEILNMDVIGGKLIDKDAEDYEASLDEEEGMFEVTGEDAFLNTGEYQEGAEAQDAVTTDGAESEDGAAPAAPETMPEPPEGFEDGAIPEGEGDTDVVEILNTFFGNQTVIDALDVDGSGDLSEAEIQTFITDIAGLDGEASDISIDDIFTSMDLINNDEYIPGEIINDTDIDSTDTDNEDTTNTTDIPEAPAAGGSSGGGGGGGGVNIPGIIAPIKGLSRAKSSTPIDTTDLQSNLEQAKSDLKEKQDALDKINSGKDENLQKLDAQTEKAYKTYQDVLKKADENLAAEIDEIEQNLSTKKSKLLNTESKIFNLENDISSAENSYDGAQKETEELKSALDELEKLDTSKYSDEKKAEISDKISELKKEIEKSEENETDSKDDLKDKKKELKELKNKQKTLNKEIAELTEQKVEKEKEAEKHPEVKQALEAYNKAQKVSEDYKAEALKSARSEVTEAVKKVSEAETALNDANVENKKNQYAEGKSRLPVNLFRKGSLYGKEDMVADAAERHGIEPELLAGIICLESGYGSSYYCNNNFNPGGTTGSGNAGYTVRSSDGFHFAKYNSIEDGVEAMAANLESYKSRFNIASIDIAHINQIGAHYCNSDWSRAVSALYQALKQVE